MVSAQSPKRLKEEAVFFLDGWLADEAVGRFADAHEAPLGSCPPRSVADEHAVWSRSSDCGHLSVCVGNGF